MTIVRRVDTVRLSVMMSPECIELDESHVPHTFLDPLPAVRSLGLEEPETAHWRLGVRDPIETGEDSPGRAVAEFSLHLAYTVTRVK